MAPRTFEEDRLDRLGGAAPCSLLRLTDRSEVVEARFCREGVESRLSSRSEALLGVLRRVGVFDFKEAGVVEEETLRIRVEA
jgi:hypothetical protein